MKTTLMILGLCCLVSTAIGQKSLDDLKKNATPDDRKAEELAVKAYFSRNDGMLAEEGPGVVNWFTLGVDVDGLGKEGDRIATVHMTKFGEATRGIILVNIKTETCVVVIPTKGPPNQAPESACQNATEK